MVIQLEGAGNVYLKEIKLVSFDKEQYAMLEPKRELLRPKGTLPQLIFPNEFSFSHSSWGINQDSENFINWINIKENDKVIIFVGTIYTFAGIENIINEFSLFEKNMKFIIIGGGPDFNRIKLQVQSKKLEKNIILLGFIPQKDIAKYVALADICLNPFEINKVVQLVSAINLFTASITSLGIWPDSGQ